MISEDAQRLAALLRKAVEEQAAFEARCRQMAQQHNAILDDLVWIPAPSKGTSDV
jgi:hypothetical protein